MPDHSNGPEPIVVAGAGYTGQRLLKLLAGQSSRIIALSKASNLTLPGVESIQIDFDTDSPSRIEVGENARVCYFVPPGSDSAPEARIKRFFEKVLDSLPVRVVLISTTGVYGNCDGEWVDETWPLNPQTDRALRRLKVEEYCSSWAERHGVSMAIFRVTGIYGPERIPTERLRQGFVLPKSQLGGFSNRIHVDDLAAICAAGLAGDATGAFNVSDGHPLRYRDYFDLVAEVWGLPKTEDDDENVSRNPISPTMRSYLRESRKIVNRKLLERFSIQLQYPHPRLGLIACREAN